MTTSARQLCDSHDVSAKVTKLVQTRTKLALDRYNERVKKAYQRAVGAVQSNPVAVSQLSGGPAQYAVDFVQRSILFWDTLRQRGNNFLEHERQGLPPVLHFDYETILDGRSLKRPVNYALLRIVPPEGVTVDPDRRPYVIIDPRGGHGPGIGGFKDDSQVGVALREGHPVYFVVFFKNPEPGQTLLDVCEAEREFVHRVRELHPNAAKPAIVGQKNARLRLSTELLRHAINGPTPVRSIRKRPMGMFTRLKNGASTLIFSPLIASVITGNNVPHNTAKQLASKIKLLKRKLDSRDKTLSNCASLLR